MRRAALSEAVIIGGGPAGSATAITLARAGYGALLIERNAEPRDKVCGDFLSGDALGLIEGFGVDLSSASTISAVRIVHRNRIAVTRLPFAARGLSRRLLDEALLRQAQANGAVVLRGHKVSSVQRGPGSMRVNCRSLGQIAADAVFLATGKHELRGAERADRGLGWVALKMYYNLAESQLEMLRDHVEVILFSGGYAGLQLVESNRAVLCILISVQRLRAVGGQWDRLLEVLMNDSHHLGDRLAGARALLDRPLAVSNLPYGYSYVRARTDPPELFRLGDQVAVIASLTGEGVSLALMSGAFAAKSWLEGRSGSDYHRSVGARLLPQLCLASKVHRMCLEPALQPSVAVAGRLWPGIMRMVAARTRIKFDA